MPQRLQLGRLQCGAQSPLLCQTLGSQLSFSHGAFGFFLLFFFLLWGLFLVLIFFKVAAERVAGSSPSDSTIAKAAADSINEASWVWFATNLIDRVMSY